MSSILLATLQHINQGHYVQVKTLAHQLGTTLATVLQQLDQLRYWGLAIESNPEEGYRLQQPVTLLDIPGLQTTAGSQLDYFVSIDSTNNYLMQHAGFTNQAHICLAEHQAKGRGRLGRPWTSPFAENIYLSLSITFYKNVNELATLSLATAVIIAQTLTYLYKDLDLYIKWPNDLYLQGKKLGGILVEIKSEKQHQTNVVVGIGINANMITQDTIDQPWVSLRQALGYAIDRTALVGALIKRLLERFAVFEEEGFTPFRDAYQQYDYLYGKEITLSFGPHNVIQGLGVGINESGQLQVATTRGLQSFSAGEATLIKNFSKTEAASAP
jgi:BirA family biotin operon repressor/biotin-[acetyl-CoA-carboxylase] ligase